MQSFDFNGPRSILASGRHFLYAGCKSFETGASSSDEITVFVDGANVGQRRL